MPKRSSVEIDQTRQPLTFLVLALVFCPFTMLRIGYLGIPEALIILLFLKQVFSRGFSFGRIVGGVFSNFWIVFLFSTVAGLLRHVLVGATMNMPGMIFDFLAYTFMFLACLHIEVVFSSAKLTSLAQEILIIVFYLSSGILLLLFFISRFTDSLFGVPLLYHGYFSPAAANIHHVAMFLAPLPFIGLQVFASARTLSKRLFIVFIMACDVIMCLDTGASKAGLALVLGIITYAIGTFMVRFVGFPKLLAMLCLTMLVVTFSALYWDLIVGRLADFFVDIDGGGARTTLYAAGFAKALRAPLLGYGPGPHLQLLQGQAADAHQTPLTVLLQAGLVGLVAYALLCYRIYRGCKNNPSILAACATILLYSLGGDILRRLPMWLFLGLFYYGAQDKSTRGCNHSAILPKGLRLTRSKA